LAIYDCRLPIEVGNTVRVSPIFGFSIVEISKNLITALGIKNVFV